MCLWKNLYVYVYVYMYIWYSHHWTFLRSSYKSRPWPEWGFEPTTTEFRWDALTDWNIKPCIQIALRANFKLLVQFHLLFSVRVHFGYCLRHSPRLFNRCVVDAITWVYIQSLVYIYTFRVQLFSIEAIRPMNNRF